jgi:hypothetical protein
MPQAKGELSSDSVQEQRRHPTTHAILITAYKDYPSLLRLVKRLDPSFFKVFIHVDKRSRIGDLEIARLRGLGAEVSKSFPVRWGSYTHLQAILQLVVAASGRAGIDYVHIISGQDYPLWNAEEFERRCDGRIFIDHGTLSEQPSFVQDRYELGDPFHFLLTHRLGSRALHKFLTRRSHRIRSWVGRRRTQFGPYRSLHKAPVWSSFPIWAARQLVDDPSAAAFLEAIRRTRLAEEIFFPTYFLNSVLAPFVAKDGLRFVDWRERNGSNPAYLDESDADALLHSDALFARKVNSECSTKLLDRIDAIRFVSRGQQWAECRRDHDRQRAKTA